jgi:DNA-binding NtrC family response regulator
MIIRYYAYITQKLTPKYANVGIETEIKAQNSTRRAAIEKLKHYLTDPGRFSVLVLGARGTGKNHWINKLQQHCAKKAKWMKKVIEKNAALVNDKDERFWIDLFEKAQDSLLVINDVEKLNDQTQELLFEAFSTGEGGKYGFEEKKYEIRIAFTSTVDVKTLGENKQYLIDKFFDRISQLVVKFPSFKEDRGSVWADFKSVWAAMDFPQKEQPGYDMKSWIEEHASRFNGNFRDLQKLTISYRNMQINHTNEKTIIPSVAQDFFQFTHFPEHDTSNPNAFYITPEMDYYEEMLPKFRSFVKKYALLHYGNLKKAEDGKPFGVPFRTMDRW